MQYASRTWRNVQWIVVSSYIRAERDTDIEKTASAPPCPLVPLFPPRAFSHRVVCFFQVVQGSAAKFIQSAKLCSTPCRPPEGSSPTDKRWEPELNAWPGHNRLSVPPLPPPDLRQPSALLRPRARAHTYTSRALSGLSDAIRVGLGLQPPWGCPFAK